MKHLCTKCREELRVEGYSDIEIDSDGDFNVLSDITCECGKEYYFESTYEASFSHITTFDEYGEELEAIEENDETHDLNFDRTFMDTKFMNMTINGKQLKEMRHALGLDYKNVPFRNYFCTDVNSEAWNDLIEKGLAGRNKRENNSSTTFWLTKEGVEFILCKTVSEKFYKEI